MDFDLVDGDAAIPGHFATQVIIDGMGGNLAAEPLSAPSKAGYVFDGWYADRTYAGAPWNFAADQVHADVTLYAKWVPGINPPPPVITPPTPTPPVITPPTGNPEPTPPGPPSLPPTPENTDGGGLLPSFVLPLVEDPVFYTPSVTPARLEEELVEQIIVMEQVTEAGEEIPVTATRGGMVILMAITGGAALIVLGLRRRTRR